MTEGRLLLGTEDGWPLGWQAHGDLHGRLGRIDGPSLADAVHAAGLRGRGGASFPTAVKLRAVAARRRAVVLVNAAEGEPLSAKDRTLCELAPHLVLDGALAAADAVRARQVVIAVRGEAKAAASSLRAALAERSARSVDVVQVPTAYLAGEESALIRHLGGGPLRPVVTPPRPAQRGLRGRPTLVQNPETLAHVALIARHGPEWFRQAGTAEDPGTALVTVSGAVARPGVAEIAHGETLRAVIDRAGGVTERPRAVLLGGFHGTWLPADGSGDLTLDARSLGHHGATLAAGVVFVLGESSCPVGEVASIVGWLAGQSAGQCGPCANGLPAIATELERIADGRGRSDLVLRWAGQLTGRGACRLPDGAVRLVRSALDTFAVEFAEHERHGPCVLCDRPRSLAPRAPVARRAAA